MCEGELLYCDRLENFSLIFKTAGSSGVLQQRPGDDYMSSQFQKLDSVYLWNPLNMTRPRSLCLLSLLRAAWVWGTEASLLRRWQQGWQVPDAGMRPQWGGCESQGKAGGLEEGHPSIWRMGKQRSHFPGTGNRVLPSSTKFTLKIDCSSIFKDSQTGWRMLAFPWGEIKLPGVSLSSWLAGPGGEGGANKEKEQGLTSSVPPRWVCSGRGRSSVTVATSEHHSGTRGLRGKRCWVGRH